MSSSTRLSVLSAAFLLFYIGNPLGQPITFTSGGKPKKDLDGECYNLSNDMYSQCLREHKMPRGENSTAKCNWEFIVRNCQAQYICISWRVCNGAMVAKVEALIRKKLEKAISRRNCSDYKPPVNLKVPLCVSSKGMPTKTWPIIVGVIGGLLLLAGLSYLIYACCDKSPGSSGRGGGGGGKSSRKSAKKSKKSSKSKGKGAGGTKSQKSKSSKGGKTKK